MELNKIKGILGKEIWTKPGLVFRQINIILSAVVGKPYFPFGKRSFLFVAIFNKSINMLEHIKWRSWDSSMFILIGENTEVHAEKIQVVCKANIDISKSDVFF